MEVENKLQVFQKQILNESDFSTVARAQISWNRAKHLREAHKSIRAFLGFRRINLDKPNVLASVKYKFPGVVDFLRTYPPLICNAVYEDLPLLQSFYTNWSDRPSSRVLPPYERRICLFRDCSDLVHENDRSLSFVRGYNFLNSILPYQEFQYFPSMPKSSNLGYAESYDKFHNFYQKFRGYDTYPKTIELWDRFTFPIFTDTWSALSVDSVISLRDFPVVEEELSLPELQEEMETISMEFYFTAIARNANTALDNLRLQQLLCRWQVTMDEVFATRSKTLFTEALVVSLSNYYQRIGVHLQQYWEGICFSYDRFPTTEVVDDLVESIYLLDTWLDWSGDHSVLSSKWFEPIRWFLKANYNFFAHYRLLTTPQAEQIIGAHLPELKDGVPTMHHNTSHAAGSMFTEGVNSILHFPENRPLVFKGPTIYQRKLI